MGGWSSNIDDAVDACNYCLSERGYDLAEITRMSDHRVTARFDGNKWFMNQENESLTESNELNEKLPAELISGFKKAYQNFDSDKSYRINKIDFENADAKIITPDEIDKDKWGNQDKIFVVYNGEVYQPFKDPSAVYESGIPKKPEGVSVKTLLNKGTIYELSGRAAFLGRDKNYNGDDTNSHDLTPDEKKASFEKSRWQKFNDKNNDLKSRLNYANEIKQDAFSRVKGIYGESFNEDFKNWSEAYKLFTSCVDRFFPDEEKVREAAQQVYEIFKGDPAVEEAWKRWNDNSLEGSLNNESLHEDYGDADIVYQLDIYAAAGAGDLTDDVDTLYFKNKEDAQKLLGYRSGMDMPYTSNGNYAITEVEVGDIPRRAKIIDSVPWDDQEEALYKLSGGFRDRANRYYSRHPEKAPAYYTGLGI